MPPVLLAAAVGLLLGSALGLFGGGGGILAVPMLVGLLGMDVDHAATASLVIVLFGALGGLISHHRAGRVLWRQGLVFGVISMAGSALGATLATRVADWIKLSAFAALMVVAGLAMLRNARSQPTAAAPRPSLVGGGRSGASRSAAAGSGAGVAGAGASRAGSGDGAGLGRPGGAEGLDDDDPGAVLIDAPAADLPVRSRTAPVVGSRSVLLLILLATGTGLVTGFLGVGGGFLVVPALVLTLRMPVANATATGLVVIAISSISALVVRLTHADALSEPTLTAVTVLATVVASLTAARFSGRLSPRALGTGFALLVLAMSVLIAVQAAKAFSAA
jgi:uncharacterized membrane protein YfcA